MRARHREGYGSREPDPPADDKRRRDRPDRASLAFPTRAVVRALAARESPFVRAEVPADGSGSWTILQDRHPGGLEELARRIALDGPNDVLKGVPIGRFGKLVTVERSEIEGFRSIRTLMEEYRGGTPSKPLSIAVFGPPGAGKSFGVVQVAYSLLPKDAQDQMKVLTFNLSQLNDPRELYSAFHQLRDEGLAGRLPLVFWDEFDTRLAGADFGWLRHFLVPMQDGTFQQGEIVHSLGPAIFVFAGGTKSRVEDFAANKDESFKLAKGPDFVSRLKGYVNVIGPNPRSDDAANDPYYVIRRALLLRSMLERDRGALFDRRDGERLRIDSAVLRAFVRTKKYLHGARSLESIVAMSMLHGKTHFERSALPAAAQLELHVDSADFLELATRPEPEEELLEELAEAAHVVYCRRMLDQGYAWGGPKAYLREHPLLRSFASPRRKAGRRKTQASLVPYEKLSEDVREQNRDQARDIPRKLGELGFVMRRARSGRFLPQPLEQDPQPLEVLAEQEHERWMWTKLRAGWSYGAVRNDRARIHPALLDWHARSPRRLKRIYREFAQQVGPHELPEKEKEKDREAVRGIPAIAAAAGYEIVRVRTPGVVVGVTGPRVLTDSRRISSGVDSALRRIETVFPDQPLTVLSALGEGTDRLVARRVLARPDARLVAALPRRKKDYLKGFRTDRSKREFEDLLAKAAEEIVSKEERDAAGTYVVDHCDVLLVVWDGRRGRDGGGTADAVRRARRRGVPIAWIHTTDRKPGAAPSAGQGSVTFEGLDLDGRR
jgi:hypothetical protein